ncbi:MAG TPA: fibronectin type III domain-containing protein [Candidatus Limisoma gallistercoris]|nr:fibronectin type III domain-containing protein [Candidatus Limisoma gallistercoris]
MKVFTFRMMACAAMACGTAAVAVAQPSSSAPVPPEYAASKVISVYSDVYSSPVAWNFGDWNSGTQYSEETVSGSEDHVAKFVTTDLGYFGLELQQDVNAATMEKVHIDVWSEEGFTFRLIPICRTQSGEIPQTVTVNADGWTSVDLDLSVYSDGGADVSGIYQLKFDQIGERTFWIDNVYFYTTSTDVDEEAPENLAAEVVSASYYSATLKCSATDNSGAVTFTVVDEANGVNVSQGAVSGVETEFVVSNLEAGKDYNFTVSASDLDGNVCETTVPLQTTTVAAPVPAAVPTAKAENVISIYSDVYEPATTFIFGSWGQTTTATAVQLGDGDNAYFFDRFNYIGMELNGNVAAFDASEMEYLHIDLYSPNITRFQITPIWGSEALYDVTVNQNEWNSIDIDLSEAYPSLNYTKIYQLKMQAEPGSQTTAFIDNIYFWKEDKSGVETVGEENGVKVYAADGGVCVDAATVVAVQVYDLAGVRVFDADVQSARISLSDGVYVVKAGEVVNKIVVR